MKSSDSPQEQKKSLEKSKDKYFFQEYKMFSLLLLGVVFLFAFHNMINTYLVQIITNVGGDSQDMGTSLAIAALCELPAMFLFSKVVKKISSNKLLMLSGVFFTIKSVAFYFSHSVLMIHLSQMLQILSFALYIPASVHYANQVMKEEDKIKGQALFTAALTAGGVVGNLLGGYLIDSKGVSTMLLWCIVFSAAGMIIFFFSAREVKNYDITEAKGEYIS